MAEGVREQLQQTLGTAFTVDRELGGGGMSRVFVATDMTLERQIVVKLVPSQAAHSVSVERFKREIRGAAKLQHPHIVRCSPPANPVGPFDTMPTSPASRCVTAGEGRRAVRQRDRTHPADGGRPGYAHGQRGAPRHQTENVLLWAAWRS
jgi:serine/threonine-protein kinase